MLVKLSPSSSPCRGVMFVSSASLWFMRFCGVALLLSSAYGISGEGDTLLQIKESLHGGETRGFLPDWSNASASSDFCKWQGVKCTSTPTSRNVISLALPGRNLSGHLSSMIGKLSRLEELDISSNRLYGSVPPELGNCTRLQHLNLSHNILSGVIPSEIGNCSKLRYINFASSNLRGTIPWEIGKLSRLQELDLSENQLNGFIPSSIGNCTALQVFAVYENNLQGHIPREFGLLRYLQAVQMWKNLVSGHLPAEMGDMLMLQEIDVSDNYLVGSLPEEIGRLKSLSYANLARNNLFGPVPSSLENLNSLQVLDLQGNQFSGTLPKGIGFLPNLTELYLTGNRLEGQLPASLGTVSDLRILDACDNRLSGEYPPEICRAKQLTVLCLCNNSLVGNISLILKDCISLRRVRLENNHFTGLIPSEISKVSGLVYLELSFNRLHGEIPAEVGQLNNLTALFLGGNHLNGSIPRQIGDLTNLVRLNLSSNNFSGNIPPQVGRLVNLEKLDLSRNSIEGAIPRHLGTNFSSLSILKLSSNNLSGTIPTSLGDCSSLIELDMSRNRLEGSIPREIGKLVNLQTGLDLSWNRLSGSLPPAIGNLLLLESLDVSFNQLSGKIPPAFSGLKLLSKFNFSFNRFAGRIPPLEAFSEGAASAFYGNDALCGPPTSNSCLESTSSDGTSNNKSLGTGSIVGIVIAGLATVMIVIVGLVYYRSKLTGQDEELNEEEDTVNGSFSKVEVDIPGGYRHRITYQEILNATEEFSDNFLIGSGSFGRVYKVLLTQAENSLAIAAKVLRLQEEGKRSLMREIEALKFVRHRNIVRLLGFVYGGSINMDILLFEYMAKGSLREALKSQRLGWKIRLNIALGVAQAMKYLHHDCTPPIIHRDLKSTNILLDDEYVAHVADFGLAKLIYPEVQSSSSSVYVGSHGYMAPEWGYGGKPSPKQDVFSFGVVLLELATGKAAIVDEEGGERRGLAEWAGMVRKKDCHIVQGLIDPELLNDYEKCGNEIEKLIEIALLCTRPSPIERPSMRRVVDSLSSPSSLVLEYASV